MIKKLLYVFIAAATFTACISDGVKDKSNKPLDQAAIDRAMADTSNFTTIQWLDSSLNFGSITEGETVNIKFRYKNVGNKPLIIGNVIPACGCTGTQFNNQPLAPGKEGEISAQFNSINQHSPVHKSITVLANTKGVQQHQLAFAGEINKPKQ
jgi:hypothetical protein